METLGTIFESFVGNSVRVYFKLNKLLASVVAVGLFCFGLEGFAQVEGGGQEPGMARYNLHEALSDLSIGFGYNPFQFDIQFSGPFERYYAFSEVLNVACVLEVGIARSVCIENLSDEALSLLPQFSKVYRKAYEELSKDPDCDPVIRYCLKENLEEFEG